MMMMMMMMMMTMMMMSSRRMMQRSMTTMIKRRLTALCAALIVTTVYPIWFAAKSAICCTFSSFAASDISNHPPGIGFSGGNAASRQPKTTASTAVYCCTFIVKFQFKLRFQNGWDSCSFGIYSVWALQQMFKKQTSSFQT